MRSKLTIFLILMLTISQSYGIDLSENDEIPQVDSWWLFNTGNETLDSFALISSSDDEIINVSLSEIILEDNTIRKIYYEVDNGFFAGWDDKKQSSEYNTTQKIRFSYLPFNTFANNTIKMNFSIDVSIENSEIILYSNQTDSYTLTFHAEDYLYNNETIQTYYFEGRIDYHYQKFYAHELLLETNTTHITENYGNGTSTNTWIYENGTVEKLVQFWEIGQVVLVTYGWFAPSIFRIVESNMVIEYNSALSLNNGIWDAKKLISYNLVIDLEEESETEKTYFSFVFFVSFSVMVLIYRIRRYH